MIPKKTSLLRPVFHSISHNNSFPDKLLMGCQINQALHSFDLVRVIPFLHTPLA